MCGSGSNGATGRFPVEVDGQTIMTVLDVSDRQRKHLLAGGTLNYVKQELGKNDRTFDTEEAD